MRPLIFLALLTLAVSARAQEPPHSEAAREDLANGVNAFKAGHLDEATRDFQSAVEAEPTWHTAHVYLGTALSNQVVPNLDTPENLAMANRALDQFNLLLASNPRDLDDLRQVASIQRNIKHFDEALSTYRKIIAIDPRDAETHYTIAVIEWTDAYLFTVSTLADESLEDDGNGNARMTGATCNVLISHNKPLIDDSIAELTRAIELRPTYDNAMSYLNLAYRRRADFDCNDPIQRKEDLATADEWTRRAAEARINRQQQAQTRDSSSKQ